MSELLEPHLAKAGRGVCRPDSIEIVIEPRGHAVVGRSATAEIGSVRKQRRRDLEQRLVDRAGTGQAGVVLERTRREAALDGEARAVLVLQEKRRIECVAAMLDYVDDIAGFLDIA